MSHIELSLTVLYLVITKEFANFTSQLLINVFVASLLNYAIKKINIAQQFKLITSEWRSAIHDSIGIVQAEFFQSENACLWAMRKL